MIFQRFQRFKSQKPHGSSKSAVNPVSRDSMPVSDFHGSQASKWYEHPYAGETDRETDRDREVNLDPETPTHLLSKTPKSHGDTC